MICGWGTYAIWYKSNDMDFQYISAVFTCVSDASMWNFDTLREVDDCPKCGSHRRSGWKCSKFPCPFDNPAAYLAANREPQP